jgi:hypothetical protein
MWTVFREYLRTKLRSLPTTFSISRISKPDPIRIIWLSNFCFQLFLQLIFPTAFIDSCSKVLLLFWCYWTLWSYCLRLDFVHRRKNFIFHRMTYSLILVDQFRCQLTTIFYSVLKWSLIYGRISQNLDLLDTNQLLELLKIKEDYF